MRPIPASCITEPTEFINRTHMNRILHAARPVSLMAFLTLVGCTSELRLHMREARTALRQVDEFSRAGDFAKARVSSIGMREEVRAALTTPVPEGNATEKEQALARLLAEWETGPWQSLDTALAGSDGPGVNAALTAVTAQCTSCHAYAGRPGIGL